ncbi:glyoxalase [Aeromicrobium sp. PE09-221]|uniref:VOC family protein n=1 Tax=Aeromicrobium sp. PE09-221 TaxID=1898043 RepID=UPI000B3E8729|nr:VOC family protein [Aeromicrobium sp. PE09-221]OUZ09542.1 glyoxalase [Aeromicrobium sp. PE09-221]
MEVLSSRALLRPVDLERSRVFYRDTLGLAIHREFGPPESPGTVFFCGNGLLEVSGRADERGSSPVELWLQVRNVAVEYDRLIATGVTALREPRTEAWGLIEAWIADPDGIRIVLVEVPRDHPLRRDQR